MFTPEIDDFIKATVQTGTPVYNQKQWLDSFVPFGGTQQICKMDIDQSQNILAIVLTDLIICKSGLGGVITLSDVILNGAQIFNFIDNNQQTIQQNDFNYIVRNEFFYFQTNNVNTPFSVGYIRISKRT